MNGPTETPQQAARRLSASAIRDGYKPEALHAYTDREGKTLHWRIRLKHPETEDKWIRPMRLNGAGYELGEPEYPDGKPLYRLQELATRPHDPVFVVEGEWCADALVKIGVLATTSGAADSAAKADWRPLAGRTVTLWPDNDEAGQRYADAVAEKLLALGCTVRVTDVEQLGLPEKGDAVDWLKANPAATMADVAALPCVEARRRATASAKSPAGDEESRLRAVETFIQSDDPEKPPRPRPQADILIDIGQKVAQALFLGDDDRAYAVVRDRYEVWPIASKRFREWLRGCFFTRVGKGANANSVRDAIETISAKAQFSGDKRKVFLRTAEADGKLYIDLTDDDWRVVEIDRDGWRVLDQSPVMFVRRGAPAPLPVPVSGGSLAELWPLLNVPAEARPLVAAWALAALYPFGPYPILMLQGEEGTAKSTTARMLRSLCDPSLVPLRAPTRDEKDFLVGAVGNWCVCVDNASDLQPWLSDSLCRLSTGGGFAARTLYTDCDETVVAIQRPVILNGIDVAAYRGDLVSRTITVGLSLIPEDSKRPEGELWTRFRSVRPRVLGALMTALSQAVRELPNVALTRHPRMADFARLAVAAETALGSSPGEFMAAYTRNLEAGALTTLEASAVAQALIAFMTARKDMTGRSKWTGTATELLDAIAPKDDDHSRSSSTWPKSGRGMAGALTRLAPALRRVGVEVEHVERVSHHEPRRIRLVCRVPAQHAQHAQHAPTGPTRPDTPRKTVTNSMAGPMGHIGRVPQALYTLRQGRPVVTVTPAPSTHGATPRLREPSRTT